MSLATLINRTIDDEFGDSITGERLTYFPSDPSSWQQGGNCPSCVISLDPSLTWRGTWHDVTQHPDDPEVRSITAHFNGTAVYVYNVLASYTYSNASRRTVTYLTFEIDGHAAGDFLNDVGGHMRYHVPVLAHEGLADGAHTLVIRTPPGPTGQDLSLVLFDYIEYTTTEDAASPILPSDAVTPGSTLSPPISPRGTSTGGMVGCAVGAAAATLAIGGILVFLWRRIRARNRTHLPLRVNGNDVPAGAEHPGRCSTEGMRMRALEEEMARIRGLVEQPPDYQAASTGLARCELLP